MEFLLEKEFLAKCEDQSDRHSVYKTTGLGLKYLALYNSIKSVAYINA